VTDLSDWQLYFNSALKKWNAGDHHGSMADCEMALRINPNHSQSIRLRGVLLYSLGELTDARVAYLETIELEDSCLYDFFDLGKIENKLGMHESAAIHLGKAIKINLQMRADQAESFDWSIFRQSSYYLANSFFNLEEYECGILAFTKWYDMHDGSEDIGPFCEAEFLRLAACLYDGSGDKERATEVINRALDLDQSSAEIWYDRGVIKRDSGDLDGAVDDFKKAFDLNPAFGMAVHNIGSICFDRGEQEEACRYWSIGADLGHLNSRTARDQYCSKRQPVASILRINFYLKKCLRSILSLIREITLTLQG